MDSKINGRYFNTECNGLLFFISEDYPIIDLFEITEQSKATYISFVFIDDSQIDDVIMLIDKNGFGRKIYVSVTCDSESAIDKICKLLLKKKISECYVSIDNAYSHLNNDYIRFGLENWKSFGEPCRVYSVDDDVSCASAIKKLQPSVLKVVRELQKAKPQNEIETIVLFDIWIQRNIQYIKNRESKADGGYYICEEVTQEATVADVLNHHYGRCEDIAYAAALVLNHPDIGVHCRVVSDQERNHAWNLIALEGMEYYTDFTHNITRNPNKFPQALKAMSYCPQFTLLGIDDAALKYGFTEAYSSKKIAQHSYNREKISYVAEILKERGDVELRWDDPPVKKSYFVLEIR